MKTYLKTILTLGLAAVFTFAAQAQEDAKTYYKQGLDAQKLFEKENDKYSTSPESADRAVMFEALLNMHDYYMKAYELDNMPNAKGQIKPKFTKKIAKSLSDYLVGYINAVGYYMEQRDYAKALRATENFRGIKKMEIFKDTPTAALDSNAMLVNFFAIVNAYQNDQKELAIQYAQEAKNSPYRQNDVYQILAQTHLELGDSTKYIETIQEGAKLFPKEAFYTVNLTNLYISQGKNDEARTFLAKAIETDPDNAQLYDVMGKLYEEVDPNKSIEWFQKALEIDPAFSESEYNIGRVYFNMAVEEMDKNDSKAAADKAKEYFTKALPYLQKAYKTDPDRAYYILANVYYRLGNEAEYNRIMKENGGI